jgi:hypothetical protein
MEARLTVRITWIVPLCVLLVAAGCSQKNDRENHSTQFVGDTVSIKETKNGGIKGFERKPDPATLQPDSIPWLTPAIVDHFLYEDKYYLKLRFTEALPGEVSISLMENNHFSTTALDSLTYQLIVYDALDLAFATLEIVYTPGTEDMRDAARNILSHRTNFYAGN